jgi:hypothetical protein
VAAPDAVNSQRCLDIGNDCTGSAAGLLALSAFWSFGNLMPDGDQVIRTPPGLAANGTDKVLLMCATAAGGTRKMPERYELYFRMGVDVLTGADNWEATLREKEPPHAGEKPATGGGTAKHKRWDAE